MITLKSLESDTHLKERAVINTDRGYYLLSQQRSLANIPTPAQAVPPK